MYNGTNFTTVDAPEVRTGDTVVYTCLASKMHNDVTAGTVLNISCNSSFEYQLPSPMPICVDNTTCIVAPVQGTSPVTYDYNNASVAYQAGMEVM